MTACDNDARMACCQECDASGTVDDMKKIALTALPILVVASFFTAIAIFWGTALDPQCPDGTIYDPQTHMCFYPTPRCDQNPLICPPLWFGGL